MQLIAGQVAVVTGAGSGIGAALAALLDRRGLRIAVCDVDGEALARVVGTLSRPALSRVIDVRDESALLDFAAEIRASWGEPHLVIANAGVAYSGDVARSTTASFQRVIDINLWGVIHTTRAFLPGMLAEKRGQVVLISSIFGIIGVANQSAYCAAKAGVRGFGESLDQELRGTGVDVMVVHPGAVATNIARASEMGPLVGKLSKGRAERMIAAGLSPDAAARKVVEGVERGRRRLLVGRDARVIDVLQRLLPVRYRWWVARVGGTTP